MRDLECTAHMGLVGAVHPKEIKQFFLRCWWDSDHANSYDTARSTSGWAIWLVGPVHSEVLLSAAAKLQVATGISTPEVELVAGANAIARSAIPLWTLLEDVYERPFQMEIGTDNSTARLDILQGRSKGMRHMKKHQRVPTPLLHETVQRDGVQVRKLDSEENTPDLLTKDLKSVETFQKHRRGLCVR